MQQYEYKVIPAPSRLEKIKGAKRPEEKLAGTLTGVMNRLAAEGWEYLRADTLPCEEPRGILSRARSSYQTVLVFRRAMIRESAEPLPAPASVRRIEPEKPATADARIVRRMWGRDGAGSGPLQDRPRTPEPEQKPTLVASAPEGHAPRIVADRTSGEPPAER